jgi:hypothetical protein
MIPVDAFAEYSSSEFQFRLSLTHSGRTCWTIEHIPSGRTSAQYRENDEKPRAMANLIKELRAAGIAPAPQTVGRKRVGKPRWKSVQEDE